MAKVKIQSSTLKKIIRGINGSPTLSLITKCVNSLRYTKYNGTSKEPLSLEEVKVSLEHYKISYIDDTITNNKSETNSISVNSKYQALYFATMDNTQIDISNGTKEIMVPVELKDYTGELHNYMMFELPYEYLKYNTDWVYNKVNIYVTKSNFCVMFTYIVYLESNTDKKLF